MKQIAIISGKGGTGKTTITAALAQLVPNSVIVDCDVDASDMHLLLNPIVQSKTDFYSGMGYSIDLSKCTECERCKNICRFDAIKDYIIDPIACEGCGACYHICPAKAITTAENLVGEYYISKAFNKPFVHAKLHVAQDNSGKLVAKIRKTAREIALEKKADYIIIDGPPGTGCPVNAAIVGVNEVIIVTEPTLSGIHDLERIIAVAKHFKIPAVVIINKYDINHENVEKITNICKSKQIECLCKIPYSKDVIIALNEGKLIINKFPDSIVSKQIETISAHIIGINK